MRNSIQSQIIRSHKTQKEKSDTCNLSRATCSRTDLYRRYGILRNSRVTIRDLRPSRDMAERIKPLAAAFNKYRIRPLSGTQVPKQVSYSYGSVARPKSVPTDRYPVHLSKDDTLMPRRTAKRPKGWCSSTKIEEVTGVF